MAKETKREVNRLETVEPVGARVLIRKDQDKKEIVDDRIPKLRDAFLLEVLRSDMRV